MWNRKRSVPSIFLLPLLPVLSVLSGACGEPPPEAAPALRPVRTQVAEISGAAEVRTYAGVAKAGLESDLSFRVPGTVEGVSVAVGTVVTRGQAIAHLDPTDYALRVKEAEAALAQARVGLRKGEADYERVRALYENNNAAKSELDAARAAADSARAQVTAAEQRREQARQQVGYTRLRAPFAGVISAVNINVNENVQAGQRAFLLTTVGEPEVEASVPEVMIARVEKGLPATVAFNALPERQYRARVTEVAYASVGSATTYPVVVQLEEVGPEVRPGMAAEVTLRFPGAATDRDRIFLPPVAVGEDRNGRFVFVLAAGGDTVQRRPVRVGELSSRGLEVTEGVAAGERVVTAGVRRLTDGERVKVVAPTAESAP
jgi:membrane fusion protein, multidrug efflux system